MKKVIALDFDGTLCENAWPGIGDPKWAVIRAAQEEQRQGALLILWTTREGPELEQALAWCEYVGLRLDGVNTSAQCWKDAYQNDPRKIGATEYWDDRAVDVATIETRQMIKEETRRRQADLYDYNRPPAGPGSAGSSKEKPSARAATTWTST